MAGTAVVVGAGVFGVTAALELAARGHRVTIVDPGPLPHPLAASTDITKMIRADYGSDELYTSLMEDAFPRWRQWNESWGEELYHEVGYLVLAGGRMVAGSYERHSFDTLTRRGHELQPLTVDDFRERFPQWALPGDIEGYFNPVGGWAESGRVVARLLDDCRAAGVEVVEQPALRLVVRHGRAVAVALSEADHLEADEIVVAAGVWTMNLVEGLDDVMWPVGQPVLMYRPEDPSDFEPPTFPAWAADIGNTGWYGFPATADGIVKISNHGPGRRLGADDERIVGPEAHRFFADFLQRRLPNLAGAPVASDRLCLYVDTFDTDFWIDRHPEIDGLTLSTGGSGHGFKFAPMLGGLTADAVEGVPNPRLDRFRWRPRGARRAEEARHA